MHRNLILLVLIFSSLMIYSQEESTSTIRLNKNSVYGIINAGYHGDEFGYGPGITYERQLVQFKKSYLYAQVGWDYWLLWGLSANSFTMNAAYILGGKSAHLELDLGIEYSFECDDSYTSFCNDNDKFKLLANAVFRYQKPGKGLILRAGVGTKALVFVSIGFSF